MTFSLLVKEINNKLIKISDFMLVQLFIIDVDVVDKFITTTIIVKIHLMNNLKVNMLINVNVLKSQKIILNFEHNIFIVNNCKITTIINLINRNKSHVKRIIRS